MKRRFVKRSGLLLAFVLGAATVVTGCVGGNCNDSTECETGFACVDYSCQPQAPTCGEGRQACSEAAQCASSRCEQGCCVAQCASRLECGEGEECQAGVCRKESDEGCKKNDDCRGAMAFCEVRTGNCVGCLDNADCDGDGLRVCGPQNQCVLAPGRCSSPGDCGANEQCVANKCESLPGCSTDAQCLKTPTTPVCRKADRECVQCLVKQDCVGDFVCNSSNECEPIYCQTNANCSGAKPACDAAGTRLCVECMEHSDCRLGETCTEKSCVPNELVELACTGDGDCFDPDTNDIYLLRCVKNAGESNGKCKAACDYYAEYLTYGATPSACPKNMACARVGWSGDKPQGACMPVSPGDANVNEACSSDVSCRTGLECVPNSATAGTCQKPCNPTAISTGCPGGSQWCRKMVEPDGQDRPKTYGLCYGSSSMPSKYLDACTTTADCDSWQVCSKGLNRLAPTESANTCKLPVGETTNIGGCNADADCESGFCVDFNVGDEGGFRGHCQRACGNDSHCDPSEAGACTKVPVEVRNAAGQLVVDSINTCVPQCQATSQCATGVDATCGLQSNIEGSQWTTRCEASTGALRGGAHCLGDTECQSGTCLKFGTNPNGICLGVCSSDIDCDLESKDGFHIKFFSSCPPAGVLPYFGMPGASDNMPTGYPAGPVSLVAPICWGATCIRDLDCETNPGMGTRVCMPTLDPLNPQGKPTFHCMPSIGSVKGGGICEMDSDCASGQCIEWSKKGIPGPQPNRCYGPCSNASDCVFGASCRSLAWPGDTSSLHMQCGPD